MVQTMVQGLLELLKKWKRAIVNGEVFGDLFTDLSKAFDCLDQACLAKLNANGFSYPALKLVYGYLPNRKQRTKTNFSHSKWPEIAFGVQQGSILDQLISNIFLTDVFSIMNS